MWGCVGRDLDVVPCWGFVNFGAGCCRSRRYLGQDYIDPSGSCSSRSRPKWVLIVLKMTCRGLTDAKPRSPQVGPARPADAKPRSPQVGPTSPETT